MICLYTVYLIFTWEVRLELLLAVAVLDVMGWGATPARGDPLACCLHGGGGGAVVKGALLATEGWAPLKGGGAHSVQRRLGGMELFALAFCLRQAVQRT